MRHANCRHMLLISRSPLEIGHMVAELRDSRRQIGRRIHGHGLSRDEAALVAASQREIAHADDLLT